MDITRFTAPDTATVAGVAALLNAATAVDSPDAIRETPASYAGYLRHGWDGELPEAYVGRTPDGRIAGLVMVHTSEWDNTHLAWVDVVVHPDHRRAGHGSVLLSFAEARARELGRTSIGADAWDGPAAIAFAATHGFEQKSAAINRRQELDRLDRRLVDKLHDDALAHASAYELLHIDGRTPDDLMDAVATMTAAINDAPTDDLDIEDEVYPRERIEGYEAAMLGRNRRFYRVVARHRETGELAGHSVVTVEVERPELGWQQDTSVVRAHRGHRLGLLVKSEMMRWLADNEPQLKSLDTWNAESNDHMIAVNEQLGYRVVARSLQFQRDVR